MSVECQPERDNKLIKEEKTECFFPYISSWTSRWRRVVSTLRNLDRDVVIAVKGAIVDVILLVVIVK